MAVKKSIISVAGLEQSSEAGQNPPEQGMNPKDMIGAAKVPLSLVPYSGVVQEAMALQEGAGKYGPFNWRHYPVQSHIYIEAALGHLMAYSDGEDIDKASGLLHLAKAKACCAILIDALMTGNLIDTRPSKGANRKGGPVFSRDPKDVLGDQDTIQEIMSTKWVDLE